MLIQAAKPALFSIGRRSGRSTLANFALSPCVPGERLVTLPARYAIFFSPLWSNFWRGGADLLLFL